jgi:hypothetical protein
MIAVLRNFSIALGMSICALFVGAGLQELFVRLVPTSRAFSLGSIDLGSWVGFGTVLFSFALAGIIQTRWLRSDAPLLWILLGPLAFLAAGTLPVLRVDGCLRHWSTLSHIYQATCAMSAAIFLLPFLGALTGLLALRLWQHLTARREVAV